MQDFCRKCKQVYEYKEEDCWWDFSGLNYDAKLVKHDECGCVNVIRYIELPNRNNWDIRRI